MSKLSQSQNWETRGMDDSDVHDGSQYRQQYAVLSSLVRFAFKCPVRSDGKKKGAQQNDQTHAGERELRRDSRILSRHLVSITWKAVLFDAAALTCQCLPWRVRNLAAILS